MHKVRYYLEVLYQMVSIYEETRCRRYIYITVGYNNDININKCEIHGLKYGLGLSFMSI